MDNAKVVKILELLEKDSSLTDEEIGSVNRRGGQSRN
jgi:hypothetical protein